MENVNEILELLEQDSKLTPEKIAVMLGRDAEEVRKAIKKCEDEKIIVKYKTLVNWEKTDRELVTALIEVKVTPKNGEGFDAVAEKIYSYPQVSAVYLMSGGYDLTVLIEGQTMKSVALFVAEKLATIDSVLSTATHFVLKKYKDAGVVFGGAEKDDRQVIVL